MRLRHFRKKDEHETRGGIARPEDVRIPIEESDLPVNRYYYNVSRIYHLAEYIFIVAALLFGITSVAANPEIISYRNFLMLVNDINASELDYNEYSTLTYSSDLSESAVFFEGGIAVPEEDSIFVFTETGRLSYVKGHEFSNPVLVGNGKNALLYDFGTTNYKIYNAYTELFSGRTDLPIYGADINREGKYTFVERGDDGSFRTELYDSEFSKIGHSETRQIVLFASPGEGNTVCTLSAESNIGSLSVKLTVTDFSENGQRKEQRLEDVSPLALTYENGRFAALFSDRLILTDKEGSSVTLKIETPRVFDMNDAGILIGSEEAISLYGYGGEEIFREEYSGEIYSAALCKDAVFILGDGKITRFDTKEGESDIKLFRSEYEKILASSKNHIVAFTKSGADLINY